MLLYDVWYENWEVFQFTLESEIIIKIFTQNYAQFIVIT